MFSIGVTEDYLKRKKSDLPFAIGILLHQQHKTYCCLSIIKIYVAKGVERTHGCYAYMYNVCIRIAEA